jgi:tetratricopeptide (TPR) repeat protein
LSKTANLPILSNADNAKWRELLHELEFINSDTHFIGLVGVNSTVLGNTLLENLTDTFSTARIPSQDDFYNNIDSFLINSSKDKLAIIPLFEISGSEHERAAQQLLLYRDTFIKEKRNILFFVSHTLYQVIFTKSYDFFSACNYVHTFDDIEKENERTMGKRAASLERLSFVKSLYELGEQQKGHITPQTLMKAHFDVASKAYAVSEIDTAEIHFKAALSVAEAINDDHAHSAALGNIGLIYRAKGELEEALKYHKKALEIDRQIGDVQGEAADLGNIGLIYSAKGELEEALKYHKKALEILDIIQGNYGRSAIEESINKIEEKLTPVPLPKLIHSRIFHFLRFCFEEVAVKFGKNAV